jgi:hypothetical protein
MKSLIISIISMAVIIGSWGIFVSFADKNIHELTDMIEDDIMVSVYDEDWTTAKAQFKELSAKWHSQKKIYTFFFDTLPVLETDYSIARAKHYIYAENVPLAAGELSSIEEQLGFLHMNELLTLDNIF